MENTEACLRLLDDLRRITNMPPATRDGGTRSLALDITVDGIGFSLMPGADDSAGCLLLFCEFGELPEECGPLAMRRLLEANLAMMGAGRPSFGINFATGQVLLSGAVCITGMTGETLARMLHHYAGRAKEWRETFFLLEEERRMFVATRHTHARAAEMMRRSWKSPATATSGKAG